jgi:hypothetical protein
MKQAHMTYTLSDADIADLAHIAARLGHERGDGYDATATVIRLGRAAQIDEFFMLKARDLAHSIRLRQLVRNSTSMRGLKPLTSRLYGIEQDAATILDVADRSKAAKGNRRRG